VPHARTLSRALKHRLLPRGTALRRVPLGIGRGAVVPIDFAHHTRLYLGLYEIELNRHLRAFCRPGLRAYDVGAQIGYDALILARLTRAPVVSFEADAALAHGMAVTFAANPALAPLLTARHATVARASSAAGEVALDDVAREQGVMPGMIKLDVDGGELEALEGAARILRDGRPHLVVETHSPQLERDCALLLRDAGYRPRVVHQRRVWPDHRPTDHNRWLVAAGAPQTGPSTAA
jgi:methyltransferase FkbM-like protein